ncbi:DNA replication complex GINS protein PSF2 [Puma concolor]|uniref:GINS complex subunit 2 n=1 Tax=Puma concolor TaxID=9696 RepID=A0A6P6HLL6_PUMCO|nr:DNA replication complex GINS protein PSF2 [Puma concolor]
MSEPFESARLSSDVLQRLAGWLPHHPNPGGLPGGGRSRALRGRAAAWSHRWMEPPWPPVLQGFSGSAEKLEKIRDHERKEETFTPMPSPYYMELTKLLLNHASDNIPKADEIRTLIKDVWDTRIAKLRVSADSFVRQQEAHAKLDNLTLMEINTSGAFLTQALNHMYKLRTNLQPSESVQSQDF